MKNLDSKFSYSILCLVIYYFIFWQEKLGVNLLIFNLLILFLHWQLNKEFYKQNEKSKILFVLPIICSFVVVFVNTEFSKLVYFLTLIINMSHRLIPSSNSSLGILVVFIDNLARSIFNALIPFKQLNEVSDKNILLGNIRNAVKVSFLPSILLIIFTLIFSFANPIFENLITNVYDYLNISFSNFPSFSIFRTFFTIGGYLLIISFFYNWNTNRKIPIFENNKLIINELTPNNTLYHSSIITFILLNILILLINIIDIKYLWTDLKTSTAPELSSMVHTGTYSLIFSILLSIIVILYYFKSNLNFHPKVKMVKLLALIWLFQNSILLVSVYVRNLNYVTLYGLTYKRIGVMIFLLITFTAIITVAIKLHRKLNFIFLLKFNSWAIYSIFIFLSIIDYDNIISNFNLKNATENRDINYLYSLSYRILPNLNDTEEVSSVKEQKIRQFKSDYKYASWLSWNYPDYLIEKSLKN